MPSEKGDSTPRREGMNMGRCVDLILFEPVANTASWNVVSVSRIEPAKTQFDKLVSQPVPFFLRKPGHVSADSVSYRHGQALLSVFTCFWADYSLDATCSALTVSSGSTV